MKKTSRRSFLKTAAIVGGAIGSTGFFVAETKAQDSSKQLNVACIGIGGKGDSDSNNASKFGNIVAICDVDNNRLERRSQNANFQTAKKYNDFRKMLEENEKNIDIVTISCPDHVHAAATLMAMRMGKSCYTQKPLTRTIYEARKLAEVAKETGVCTQMGNQGTALDSSRTAISLMKEGIIGKVKEVIVWSNRPIWPQYPGRRETLTTFAEKGLRDGYERHEVNQAVWNKYDEISRNLQTLDWKLWLGTAPYRDFYPGLYHDFAWRGWWDFGSGALGDMACHMMTVPFAAAGLKDPTWVRAKSTGHDFDSFPQSSIIEFEFPANSERGKIPFWWYDREGNKPPMEQFTKYGIKDVSNAGVLIVGEKGAMYSTDDYCGNRQFFAEGGEKINENEAKWKEVKDKTVLAEKKGDNDTENMWELFRAVLAKDPKICQSNFVDRAGPLTETILLGNLAVWAASKGGSKSGSDEQVMGDWGEKVEWDAKNLVVTNLSSLKTPGVADLVKPIYTDGYRLD
ncbi:MAG: Gfo/Idh/MocA family oxidoreductase [Planctomycetaceae bacterium]|jgi:predicted dehydrogenase|nr:Gfo/Idh/MocA family oxidoreductase [Planctomycetaceae bacterium]